MQPKITVNTDVQLLAMMVAKLLHDQGHSDDAPSYGEYEVLTERIRLNNSTDIRVPVRLGRGLSLSVKQHWWVKPEHDLAEIAEAATEIADNIVAVHELRADIIVMTKEVRSAVTREIAKAMRRGLKYRLISALPYIIERDVNDGFAVDVIFERLSEALRPELASFGAECADEVVEAFECNREEQESRMVRRLNLEAAGATGRIDSVVVNAMRDAGHDIADVLKLLVTKNDKIVKVAERGNEASAHSGEREDDGKTFRLHWNTGDVCAQIRLDNGVTWHEGRLTFQNAPISSAQAKGQRVSDILANPIFGDVRVSSGSVKKGGAGSLYCTQDFLNFDAETGRLWAA